MSDLRHTVQYLRSLRLECSRSWSAKATGCPAGDPELRYYLGELFHRGADLFRIQCVWIFSDLGHHPSPELDYPDSEAHLLCSGTRDSARLLAQVLFEWSRAGADPAAYACRGVMPFLLTTNILAARTFLDNFLPLVLASKSDMLLQKDPVAVGAGDEIWTTNDHTLNFLQMAVRICQRADPDAGSKPFSSLLSSDPFSSCNYSYLQTSRTLGMPGSDCALAMLAA